ncbi:MAG: MmcQ/YjbR family DNA-binding protein [Actinomycetota bacterium]
MNARQLRKVALELPEAEERETWETATFRVHDKIFAMCSEQERHVWIKSAFDEQQALVHMDPDAFFVPPYVGSKGWIGVVLAKAACDEVTDLVVEAWRSTAPKRLVRAFDEGTA